MRIGKYNNMVDFGGHSKFTGVEKDPYIVVPETSPSSMPSDYSDITSIANFDLYYKDLLGTQIGFKDEKAVQREIDALANSKCNNDVNANWGNLDSTEQYLYCKWVTSKVSHINFGTTVPDPIQRQALSFEYDRRNTMSRGTWRVDGNGYGRLEVLRIYLFGKIGATNALSLMKDAVSEGLIESYRDGIESLETDGIVGLKDFFLATAGTKYDGSTDSIIDGLLLRTYPIIDYSGDTITTVAYTCASIMDGYY